VTQDAALSPDTTPGLAGALALEHALGLAYVHLNRRERTQHELREHLLTRDVQPEVAEEAIAELTHQGYLNDERFVRLFIQDKGGLDEWGSERIRGALLTRGIPADLADTALATESWPDELERALGLLQRRFPDGLADRRESERALGVLLRKGYEYELAADALSEHRRRVAAAAG
jgi:regulatory protein